MAKAYRARHDVTLPRVIAEVDREGQDPLLETEGITYPVGSAVLEKNMTPRDRKRAESGELDHLLEPLDVSDEQVDQIASSGGGEPEFGVFVAEHEAEAHALLQYGHHVVPDDQVQEVQASGSQHAADYQRAAAEHGLDRRPAQEAMAQPRERVPDELLTGGETRTGAPFNRGPEGPVSAEETGESDSESSSGDSGSGETLSARPRPTATEQRTVSSPAGSEQTRQEQTGD